MRIAAEHSPWGRFAPGSWQQVRITTETLTAEGGVETVAVTERKSTLVALDEQSFTLRIEAAVEVAGRQFDAPVQTVRYAVSGEPLAGEASETIRAIEETSLKIEGVAIPVQVGELSRRTEEGLLTARLFYSPLVPPYVLRRETTVRNAESSEVLVREVAETLWFGFPQRVKQGLQPTTVQSVVRNDPHGTTRTLRWLAAEVPGELIAAQSKELDAEGRLLRRSLIELIDYRAAGR